MYSGGSRELLRVGWVAGEETLERQGWFLPSWVAELSRQGIHACLLYPRNGGRIPPPMEGVRAYAASHWLTRKGDDKTSGFVEVLREADVDVLHALDESTASRTAAAAERLGCPCFISCCRRGVRLHLPHKVRHRAILLAAGEAIREDLCKRRVVSEERIRLLRPGVSIARAPRPLEFRDRRATILADVYDADSDLQETVLRSFDAVRQTGIGAVFCLLHSPRQERALRRRTEAMGLATEVVFVSHGDAGQAMLAVQSADVFLAVSARREFDWGALAAMAAGVPVLAIPARESDFQKDGLTATVLSPGEAETWAERLTNLLTAPAWGIAQAGAALQYLHVYHNLHCGMSDLAQYYRAAREGRALEAVPSESRKE